MQAQGTSCHQRQVSNAGSLRAHASSRAHPRCPKAFSSQILQRAQRRRALRGASLQVFSAAQPVTSSAGPKSSGSSNGSEVYDVVVVGAGVSGLTTALALQSEHASEVQRLLVTEGRDRVGGNVTTVANPQEGYLWEEGPNSFQPSDAILKAAVDAGIEKDLVLGDPTAPRFVYWDGKLRPTPSGLDALTFDLMSIWGKIRAGLGVVGLKAPMPDFEENIEQFIKRNLGDEVFYRLIEPFCSGVYAGNPAKLSMKAAFGKVWELEKKGGSIIGGTFKLMQERKANPAPPRDPRLPPKPKGQTVGSFRQGLKMLPEAIAAKLGGDKVRTGWQLENIYKDGDLYKLMYKTPQGTQEVRSRVVALTVPAYVAADLVRREAPEAAEALKSLDYPPVAAVTLSYPKSAVRQDRFDGQGNVPGFGQLHPRTQGVTTLGTIYSSSLFPGRAPDGQILLLNYIGGALNRGIVDQKEDDLVAQVDKDLRKMLLRPDAPAPRKIAVRVWPKAIPQFNVGHLDVVQAARDDLADAGWEGVLLGGNYVSGVALGKCIEYGYEYAKQVAQACKRASSSTATRNGDEAFFV